MGFRWNPKLLEYWDDCDPHVCVVPETKAFGQNIQGEYVKVKKLIGLLYIDTERSFKSWSACFSEWED